MKKVLEYIISAVDKTKSGTRSAIANIKSVAASIGKNLMNIKAGFEMARKVISVVGKAIWSTLKESFKFETLTTQFNTLIGDIERTKRHMQDLKELGDTPPFSLEQMAKASRTMLVMSEGALGWKDSLVMVGDAAAATGNDVGGMADAVGRAYAIIRDGQPITRATMQLRNMGIITPELAAKLADLQKQGASNIDIWKELEKALLKHKGAMEETEKTGQGLVDAIGSQWTTALRTFGDAMKETSKDELGGLLEKLKELNEDGTIALWADRAYKALKITLESARAVGKALGKLYQWSGLSDVVAGVKGVSRFAGTLAGGGSIKDAGMEYLKARSGGFYGGLEAKLLGDAFGAIAARKKDEQAQKEADKRIMDAAAAKKKVEQIEAAKTETDNRKKLIDDMAAAQAKQDAKRLAEEEAKRLEMLEKERKERERIAREQAEYEHRLRVGNLHDEISTSMQMQRDAGDRVSRARAASAQAWSWYRDPEAFARQLEEERAETEAQKQFKKDLESLQRRRGWKTSDRLTERQEAVRRVALAREEEKRAEVALIKIEENTANLEAMLKELLTMQ